jgi:rod shape-determining protein MreC
MKNLFAFVARHNFIFIFLLLQLVCIWLMVQHRGYQGSRVLNSSNQLASGIYQQAAHTREYFSLKVENEKLARENAVLRNFLKSSHAIIPQQVFRKNDTVYKQQYTYISAKVVNSSVNKRRNFMTLDVGSEQGVSRDMAVMSSEGIVGRVTDVSRHFSTVMSLLHKDSKINCELKKDNTYGPLSWDGGDYRHCQMGDIPQHVKMKAGDTVITSELSGIFPKGLMVGTIIKFERRQNESFFTARVRLAADLKKVNHVYVITNKYKNERDSLESKTQVQIDD